MREWLIKLGQCMFDLGHATTTNGLPPQQYQYYGIGLYLFIYGCVSCGILVIIGIVYLIKRFKRKKLIYD